MAGRKLIAAPERSNKNGNISPIRKDYVCIVCRLCFDKNRMVHVHAFRLRKTSAHLSIEIPKESKEKKKKKPNCMFIYL